MNNNPNPDTNVGTNTSEDELRRELLSLKDVNGDYVISSLIAGDPYRLKALIKYIQNQTQTAYERGKRKTHTNLITQIRKERVVDADVEYDCGFNAGIDTAIDVLRGAS